MIQINFNYDEKERKWQVFVKGATDPVEARQAFSAVVLSCKELNSELLIHTQVTSDYQIIPAV